MATVVVVGMLLSLKVSLILGSVIIASGCYLVGLFAGHKTSKRIDA